MSTPYQPYPQGQPGGYGPQGGLDPNRGYLQGGPVGFGEAVSEGFKNILTFTGRASRSAFWWWFLGAAVIDVIGIIIGGVAGSKAIEYLFFAVVGLASLSLAVRRMHDSGKSGFWYFIALIPLVGSITLLVFYLLPGTPGPNKYDA